MKIAKGWSIQIVLPFIVVSCFGVGEHQRPMSFLRNLKSLQSLELEKTEVEDLQPIGNLTSLRGLGLQQTPVNDLSPLAKLKELSYLNLTGSSVKNIGPLVDKRRSSEPLVIVGAPEN